MDRWERVGRKQQLGLRQFFTGAPLRHRAHARPMPACRLHRPVTRLPGPPVSRPPQVLTEALHEFVEKDNKDSWREAVARALQETQVRQCRRPGGT